MNYLASLILFCLLATSLGNESTAEFDDLLSYQITSRVVGGSPAGEQSFPYQASLQINGKHFCGGSIIHPEWILTAGHCLRGAGNRIFTVVVGTTNLTRGGLEYQVKRTVLHPDFDMNKINADIGLIQVTQVMEQSPKVKPVDLPTSDISKANTPVVSSGFGKTWVLGKVSMELKFLNTKILNHKLCRLVNYSRITEKNICTISRFGKGVCHGDSGGPLVANGVQIGVVSWGIPCALGLPDVYTRVYSYVDWIHETINN